MARPKNTIGTIEIDSSTMDGLDGDYICQCEICGIGHDVYSSEENADEKQVCEYCYEEEKKDDIGGIKTRKAD